MQEWRESAKSSVAHMLATEAARQSGPTQTYLRHPADRPFRVLGGAHRTFIR
jgi:hypothetical protein